MTVSKSGRRWSEESFCPFTPCSALWCLYSSHQNQNGINSVKSSQQHRKGNLINKARKVYHQESARITTLLKAIQLHTRNTPAKTSVQQPPSNLGLMPPSPQTIDDSIRKNHETALLFSLWDFPCLSLLEYILTMAYILPLKCSATPKKNLSPLENLLFKLIPWRPF